MLHAANSCIYGKQRTECMYPMQTAGCIILCHALHLFFIQRKIISLQMISDCRHVITFIRCWYTIPVLVKCHKIIIITIDISDCLCLINAFVLSHAKHSECRPHKRYHRQQKANPYKIFLPLECAGRLCLFICISRSRRCHCKSQCQRCRSFQWKNIQSD